MESNKRIIFSGGGGHALSLLETLPTGSEVLGYLAPNPSASIPLAYLGDDSDAPRYKELGYPFHIAFVYARIPTMEKRSQLISLYESMGANFASIISPTAIITPHATIGNGVAVLNKCLINRATIGDFCIINSGAIIEHDCVIGKNTFIGPGAIIGGGTIVGENCFIGMGACLKNGITIAPGTTIGMGGIVTHNISDPGIYHGFPLHYSPIHN